MRRDLKLVLVAATVISAGPLAAQSSAPKAGWTPPKTSFGQPDLQGVWVNPTLTPFERPAALKDKAVLTDAEAADIEKRAAERRQDEGPPQAGDVGTYNQFWTDSGDRVVSTRRTSLVVDPPDGRVPLRPEAESRRDDNHAHEGDSYTYMSVWDRCITRGVPSGMFPAGYNNAYQIIQTRDYVTIQYEMIHETRVIPLDGRPHLPPTVRLWNGDSRGHWDGTTLVVDTTNFSDKGWIATQAAAGRIKGIPQSEKLHVVERFTPTDRNTITYEATIEDPDMYTRRWTVSIPLHRDREYQIYEYACHEGNHAVAGILAGARAKERR
jgi:hypothetical protein